MRLGVSSLMLCMALGVAGCAMTAEDPPGPAPGAPSAEIRDRAVDVVKRIEGLMVLNHVWIDRMRPGATTPPGTAEAKDVVPEMQAALAALPADADWVTAEVRKNQAGIEAGFAAALRDPKIEKQVGKDKVQALQDAVQRAGGITAVLLRSAASVHEHAAEMSDRIGRGEKMTLEFFCALAGTVAGANAARQQWTGMIGPIFAAHAAGGLH